MRRFWVKSIPALTVLFVLAFGFMVFHVSVKDVEATGGAECNYLQANCDQEKAHVNTACAAGNGNAQRCSNAISDAMQVCNEYYNTCT